MRVRMDRLIPKLPFGCQFRQQEQTPQCAVLAQFCAPMLVTVT